MTEITDYDFTILQPCPFCGSRQIGVNRRSFGTNRAAEEAAIVCQDCQSQTSYIYVFPGGFYETARAAFPELARRWNRRPPVPPDHPPGWFLDQES